jgi:hypothetical protein
LIPLTTVSVSLLALFVMVKAESLAAIIDALTADAELHTPLEPNPTMSAFASPVMSATSRGKVSLLLQPPALAPNPSSTIRFTK